MIQPHEPVQEHVTTAIKKASLGAGGDRRPMLPWGPPSLQHSLHMENIMAPFPRSCGHWAHGVLCQSRSCRAGSGIAQGELSQEGMKQGARTSVALPPVPYFFPSSLEARCF